MSEKREIEKIIEAESNEVENASLELAKTSDEVYKILGGIMIRANKDVLMKELEEKKKLIIIKVSALEKQEESIAKRSDEMRSEIQKSLSANPGNSK